MNVAHMIREGRWHEVVARYIAEGRTVSGGKGDQKLAASETTSLANQEQQLDFNKQLIGIFNSQYGDQKAITDYLTSKVKPMIDNPTGYSDKALATMRTSASDTNAQAAQNAEQAMQAKRFSMGGRDLPSGVDAQLEGAFQSQAATNEANTQNGITMADENLKNANYWNALSVLGGNAAMINPQSYAGAAEGAAGASSGAADATAATGNAYANSKKGFFTTLADSFATGLGGGLGGFLGGGAGVKPFGK